MARDDKPQGLLSTDESHFSRREVECLEKEERPKGLFYQILCMAQKL